MVGLVDVDPDPEQLLSVEERLVAHRVRIRVYNIVADRNGVDADAVLEDCDAFGAIVLDGILAERLRVADQIGLRLLGVGDIVTRTPDTRLTVVAEPELRGTPGSRLALLDDTVLSAVRQWPTIAVRLLERFANQSRILAAQLVIAELPRVDQRLFALMWLPRDQALEIPLKRPGQRLIEVVDVEHQPPIRCREPTEVRPVRIPAQLHTETRSRRTLEIGRHQIRGTPIERT
jgi:hypothetical protein